MTRQPLEMAIFWRHRGIVNSQDVRLSRYMSLLLRHRPEAAGLMLDGRGWVAVDSLLEACIDSGRASSRSDFLRVVAENDKKRFELSADGLSIRAAQGHSIELDLDLEAVSPPAVLYHGTVDRFLDRIKSEGLRPMKRLHVHLSADEETARRVGSRRGAPVILRIDAAAMHEAGLEFFRASNGVWLTGRVDPVYLRFD